MISMRSKGEYPAQRIAAISIFGVMGAAFVGPSVNSIISSQQMARPLLQWEIDFLIIGVILFVIALLILIPISWWLWIRRQFANTPKNISTVFWLQSVLHSNENKVYTSVKSHFTDSSWDFSGLRDNSLNAFFKINLELINTSIFDMCLIAIEGKIFVDSNECLIPPIIDKRPGINQGETCYVTITQQVSEQMSNRLKNAANKEQLKFDLRHINLILETTTKIHKGYKATIKFDNTYSIMPSY